MSELRHRENGPVHINFIVENDYPIYQGIVKFDENKLPFVRKIDRLTLEDSKEKWLQYYKLLTNSKVLIVYGQAGPVSEYDYEIIQKFCDRFNCIVSIDLIANLHGRYCIPTYAICKTINASTMKELVPDIVITMNANTISEIKSKLTHYKDSFIHWHVSSKGEVSDPFKILSDIIECSPITFFEKFVELSDNITSSHEYYEMWKIAYERIGNNGSLNEETIEFSALYATQQFASRIPANSLLHIANSNSIRLINFFEIDPSIIVFGNRGAHGIDGSMSSFIGQSCVSKKLSFLVIGDLSFFYDMNALWNQYVGNNVRILVCNNSGGAIFHTYPNTINVPTLDEHIAAEHQTSVKDWVKSRGFKYLSANNKKEFDIAISQFMCIESDAPVLLEVFTDKEIDATAIKTLLAPYQVEELSFKDVVKKHVPVGLKNAIKKIIR